MTKLKRGDLLIMRIEKILDSALKGKVLNKKEAVRLLNIKNASHEFYNLLSVANKMTRLEFDNKGYIFAQIGLNAEPCSKNCKFCSMGKNHYSMESQWEKDTSTILDEVESVLKQSVNDIFLMITADYSLDKYIKIASEVKKIIPENIKLVANMGDFDYETACKLKKIGFTGIYHILRLREGIDTDIAPEVRIKTLEAIRKAELDLYYCVEPIGPEHTYEELVDEMIRARDYDVSVMAVMRRIPVKGTPLCEKGQISAIELTKIAAVTRIVSGPKRAMNAHEVTPMTLLAGVNQLYAEYGANPRDNESNTEKGRGYSAKRVRQLLADAEYDV